MAVVVGIEVLSSRSRAASGLRVRCAEFALSERRAHLHSTGRRTRILRSVRLVHRRALIVGRIARLRKRRDRRPCVVLFIVAFLRYIVVQSMSFFIALRHEAIIFPGPSEWILRFLLLFHVLVTIQVLCRFGSCVAVVVNLEWTCLRQPSHVAVVECGGDGK